MFGTPSLTRFAHPTFAFRAVLALTVWLVPMAATADGTPDQSCRAAKLKAAGKYASALATCHSKAAIDASMLDAECLSKASGKLTDAFTTADTKGDSTCGGLEPSTLAHVQSMVEAVIDAAPAAPGGGKCPSGIYKAAGKLASGELSAWSKFVIGGDVAKRNESIAKALGKHAGSVTKAEEKSGCSATGQGAAVTAAVEEEIEPIIACIAYTGSCAEVEVEAGELVTTDPDGDGPDADTPLVVSVQTQGAGTVTLHIVDAGSPPGGYEILGQEVEVSAPPASPEAPLVLTFVLDASLLPVDPMTVTLARNGVVVPDCSGLPGSADPDPCIDSRAILAGGDLRIIALASQASRWSMLVPTGPTTTTTTLSTTTTTLPFGSYWMRLEVRADQVGSDVATELDFGWSGNTHDIDSVNGWAMRLRLDCPSASLPSYGECTVTGFDTCERGGRCLGGSFDGFFCVDSDFDCVGAPCICNTRPPLPAVVGSSPVCIATQTVSNASGAWNPDTGSGDFTLSETLRVYLGISSTQPCPVCVGDPAPNDGMGGGTCNGGQNSGGVCDANGSDPSYPLPGGGWTSFGCPPTTAANISGSGLRFPRTETTSSVSLPSSMPCIDNPSENCACAACSSNTTFGCSNNAECVAKLGSFCSLDSFRSCDTNVDCTGIDGDTCNPGTLHCTEAVDLSCLDNADCDFGEVGPCVAPTCDSRGGGNPPSPDVCSTSCNVGGDGEGECSGGPVDLYCDALVEEDGKGIVACAMNTDCSPSAGNCLLQVPRNCFGSTIAASGVTDSDSPRTVAALCIGVTSNPAINVTSGLPGPARLRTDWTATYGQQ